jgi:hypothetical protein
MAQSLGPTEAKWGRLVRCWRLFKFHFANVSRKVGARGIQSPKSVQPQNLTAQPPLLAGQPNKWAP